MAFLRRIIISAQSSNCEYDIRLGTQHEIHETCDHTPVLCHICFQVFAFRFLNVCSGSRQALEPGSRV